MALTKISTGGVKDDAASQAKIADEAVDEARLQISNAGTNGQFLSKQSGNTGGLTWATVESDKIEEGNSSVETVDTGSDGHVKITTEGTERVRVIADGKVGIGTTTPGNALEVAGDIEISGSNGRKITFSGDGSSHYLKMDDTLNGPILNGYAGIAFETGGTNTRFQIGSAGQLGVGGATYGSSGQVLTSGGASAAPSWTTISAAPEVSLVADGAIAANKPVVVQSDGKIKEVKETITVTDPPDTVPSSTSSTTSMIANRSRFNCCIYIPEKKRIVGGWLNDANFNYPYIKAGKMNSDGTVTWGGQVQVESNTYNAWMSIAYDPENDKVLALFKDGNYDDNNAEMVCSAYTLADSTLTEVFKDKWIDSQDYGFEHMHLIWNKMKKSFFACARWDNYGNRGFMTSFSPNYGTGAITDVNRVRWGPHEEDNSGEHAIKGYDVAQNTSGSEIMFSYVSDGTYASQQDVPWVAYKGIDTDGSHLNSESQHKRVQISTLSCSYTTIAYDPDNDLYVIAYCEHQGDMKARTLTTSGSGNSISFSLGTEITVNTESSRISMEYDSAVNKFGLRYNGADDDPYIVYLTVSGTSLSTGTAKQLNTEANNNALDTSSQTVTFDESQGRMFCLFTQGTSTYTKYKTVKSGTSTTTLSDSYIGFSTAAINDTATGTIAVTGNTNSNQSGLTAGSKHYVHRDGSLKTTVDTSVDSSPEAGTALSSTKLLIKG